MIIQSMYPYFIYIGLPVVALVAYWRWYYYKRPVYRYSSLNPLGSQRTFIDRSKILLFMLRLLTLSALCFALARFRVPDERSKVPVQGVDIMLVLDVSGSMQLFDDINDPRPRIDVARKEGIKFIQKRENDPIGLVIFGNVAVSRAPLTLDKNMLIEILKETSLGIVDPDGTVLARAIVTAANRLKNSMATSKIMIVLTDGQPSERDIEPQIALDLAKKLGIKIYTIGIGSEEGGLMSHPWAGIVRTASTLNIPLLEMIAQNTGGQFFQARNPKDMESIYTTIDQLERTEHEAPVFARYFEYFIPFLWFTSVLLLSEIFLASIVWLSL